MRFLLLIFHLLVTLLMIAVILLQKGEDAGSGMGSSSGLFSARGAKNGLTLVTTILGALFFLDCLGLVFLIKKDSKLEVSVEAPVAPSPSKLPSPASPFKTAPFVLPSVNIPKL